MLSVLRLVLVVLLSAAASCARFGSCEAQDVHGLNVSCSGPQGWMWNGSACVYTHACNCTGDDCQGLYQQRDACEAAHAHCGS